jgi:hypothetical protein
MRAACARAGAQRWVRGGKAMMRRETGGRMVSGGLRNG